MADSKKEFASTSIEPSPFTESISKPLVKLDCIPRANIESLSKVKGSNLDILRTISEQIKDLDISAKNKVLNCLNRTCQQNDNMSSSTDEQVVTSSSDNEEIIATIQRTINEEQEEPLAVNKINS